MSKREDVLNGLKALLTLALPAADIKRNADKPNSIGPGGMVIIRDGELVEDEVLLGPLLYLYDHHIALEVAGFPVPGDGEREYALDVILAQIGAAVLANRTMSGLVDFLEAGPPISADAEVPGAASFRWADVTIVASYSASNALV